MGHLMIEIAEHLIIGEKAHQPIQNSGEGLAKLKRYRMWTEPPGKRLNALRAQRAQLQGRPAASGCELSDIQEARAMARGSIVYLSYKTDELVEEGGQDGYVDN